MGVPQEKGEEENDGQQERGASLQLPLPPRRRPSSAQGCGCAWREARPSWEPEYAL